MIKYLKRTLSNIPPLYFLAFWVRYKMQLLFASHLIIITTPGHVGSSTVFKSLGMMKWPQNVRIYDIHSLRERFNNSSAVHSVSARHVLQEVIRKLVLSRKFVQKKITVITVVRDPVARALGGMFQNSTVFIKGINLDKITPLDYNEALLEIRKQLVQDGLLDRTLHWQLSFYKDELREFWKFPIENLKLEEGLTVLQNKNHTLIMFTLEKLADSFEKVMKEVFETSGKLIVANANTTEFYQYCKDNLSIDRTILERIYHDEFWKKVYSEEDIQGMIMHWSKSLT